MLFNKNNLTQNVYSNYYNELRTEQITDVIHTNYIFGRKIHSSHPNNKNNKNSNSLFDPNMINAISKNIIL